MSETLDTLLRFERGELGRAEADDLRRRLAGDSEARAWLEWIGALRAAADVVPARPVGRVDPAGHGGKSPDALDGPGPDPIEIAALAEGTLPAAQAEAVRAALARSPDGYEQLAAALHELRALAAEAAAERGRADARRPRSVRRWIPAAVLAAAAAVLFIALQLGGAAGGPPAKRTPLPTAVLRGAAGDALSEGLDAYRAGDWQRAAERLAAAVELEPTDGRARLYLGSALLLAGRDGQARAALERAVELAQGTYADEARMQLAQACIAEGDLERAAELLRELAAGEGHRAAEARAQLEDF